MANLPIFFIHGAGRSAADGIVFDRFATEQRPVISLNFAENEDTFHPLPDQVQLAIEQIRSYTRDDARFNNGYTLIGVSLGGVIARGIVEEMDDHNVQVLISLASPHAGLCHGPQADPSMAQQFGIALLNSYSLPVELFDFASYSIDSIKDGHLLVDLMEVMQKHPELTQNSSITSLLRYPVRKIWLDLKPYLATIGNLEQPGGEGQQRRKSNLLKLKEFHAFTSPQDGVLEPYQSGVFGHYSEVANSAELLDNFKSLGMVDMKDTVEYMQDTYGLRSLDERGALFRHVVDKVPHMCWIADYDGCYVDQVLDTNLGPILN
ncbi:hypothetical protein Poli38472_010454 [Pythium oligandrum]|uniref:Uncharacterized protein n=1 Tax=Pythium oligandrum TaxID=41045 RepID=A0A8K1C3Q4_PYTOL|nr:hypothetical protein Poli38472_010454 [Pythium oligandrum]|eukprot:TMW55572.1 hypothetical protein Poli38472_010454 [Pythium oligandrum]